MMLGLVDRMIERCGDLSLAKKFVRRGRDRTVRLPAAILALQETGGVPLSLAQCLWVFLWCSKDAGYPILHLARIVLRHCGYPVHSFEKHQTFGFRS